MKRNLIYIITAFCLAPLIAKGQGENNVWTFACYGGYTNLSIDFNTPTPTIQTTNTVSSWGAQCAVCYPNGQLRFIFCLRPNTPNNLQPEVFHPDGTTIANSDLLSGLMTDGLMPIVVQRPGNADQYYLVYSYSNGLVYSLLDMSLNNGSGAIVNGWKDIVFAPYGSIIPSRTCAILGCDGVWIVTHSRTQNEYISYHITASGVDTSAVISPTGNFAIDEYSPNLYPQRIKTSDNGHLLALITWKGIEVCDFEKCNGKVKNARVLDTTGNEWTFAQSQYYNRTFRDICFSPDATKLYVTSNQIDSQYQYGVAGKLYQYDLEQPTWSDVIASKSLIMTNQPSIGPIFLQCIGTYQDPLGEMKIGPDRKLYVDNGSETCKYPWDVPVGYNPGAGFHTVDYPNLLGSACEPHFNTIVVEGYDNTFGHSFLYGNFGGSMLQQNLVIAPPMPDTIQGRVYDSIACFVDSLLIQADSIASCYQWDNGITERDRYIHESGTYFVHYFKDCTYSTDTFHVSFAKIPYIGVVHQNCPGMHIGAIAAYYQDNTDHPMQYTWRSEDSSVLQQRTTNYGDTLSGLDSGSYYVTVTSASGCDTTLNITVENMPKPEINTSPTDTTIRYGDAIILNASGAVTYLWEPDSFVTSGANTASPLVRPMQPTVFNVIGTNQYGCQDTSWVHVDIDYNMPILIPNAFSPNGDGKNDVFKIEGFTYQQIKQFYIFNRFGEVIFITKDGSQGWDGNQNGKPCDMGTYYYLITVDFPDGSTKTYKGDIALMR